MGDSQAVCAQEQEEGCHVAVHAVLAQLVVLALPMGHAVPMGQQKEEGLGHVAVHAVLAQLVAVQTVLAGSTAAGLSFAVQHMPSKGRVCCPKKT